MSTGYKSEYVAMCAPRIVGEGDNVCPMCVASFAYCSSSVMTAQSRTLVARTTRAPVATAKRTPTVVLLGSDVCSGDPTVDEERRAADVRRFVGRKEERGVHDLARLRQPAGRDVHE